MSRLFRIIVVAAVLVAPASASAKFDIEQLASKRVAIVNVFDDAITLSQLGITIFGNYEKRFTPTGFSVEETLLSVVRKKLSLCGVDTVVLTRDELEPYKNPQPPQPESPYGNQVVPNDGPYDFVKLATDRHVDYLILNRPISYFGPKPSPQTNGFAIYQRIHGYGREAALAISLSIDILDAKTGKRVLSQHVARKASWPYSVWVKKEENQLSPASSAEAKEGLNRLAHDSYSEAFKRAFGDLPCLE